MKLKGASIPETIVRRVKERRGTEHSFADLDPTRTALVVIDLQHAFMNEAVGFAAVPAARDIVSAVNRLAAAVRETGGAVFWIKMTHDERCFADWSVASELPTPEFRDKRIAALSPKGRSATSFGRSSTYGRKTRSSRNIATARLCRAHATCPTGCALVAAIRC